MFYLNLLLGWSNPDVWVFDPVKSRKNFVKMIISHEYPFNCASHHFFKVFVSDMRPYFKMLSRNTIRLNYINIYEEESVTLNIFFDLLICKTILNFTIYLV
jgi:hypothetical protein